MEDLEIVVSIVGDQIIFEGPPLKLSEICNKWYSISAMCANVTNIEFIRNVYGTTGNYIIPLPNDKEMFDKHGITHDEFRTAIFKPDNLDSERIAYINNVIDVERQISEEQGLGGYKTTVDPNSDGSLIVTISKNFRE